MESEKLSNDKGWIKSCDNKQKNKMAILEQQEEKKLKGLSKAINKQKGRK